MCLKLIQESEKNLLLEVLPEEFTVYKVCDRTGTPEFWKDSEDSLLGVGIHEATECRGDNNRTKLNYPVGFHAFFTYEAAKKYQDFGKNMYYIIRSFKVRKEWLNSIGRESICSKGLCGVFCKIEVV